LTIEELEEYSSIRASLEEIPMKETNQPANADCTAPGLKKLPPGLKQFQDKVKDALDSPIGKNMDIFSMKKKK
jgi:hypothetical protein